MFDAIAPRYDLLNRVLTFGLDIGWRKKTVRSLGLTQQSVVADLFAGRSRFHNVFHYRAVTWADQIAIAYLVDAAAFASQRAVFAECSYGPYKRILKRIVAEEGFHMRHGEEMLLKMAEGTPVQHRMFQEALDRWWWPSHCSSEASTSLSGPSIRGRAAPS